MAPTTKTQPAMARPRTRSPSSVGAAEVVVVAVVVVVRGGSVVHQGAVVTVGGGSGAVVVVLGGIVAIGGVVVNGRGVGPLSRSSSSRRIKIGTEKEQNI